MTTFVLFFERDFIVLLLLFKTQSVTQ